MGSSKDIFDPALFRSEDVTTAKSHRKQMVVMEGVKKGQTLNSTQFLSCFSAVSRTVSYSTYF